MNPHLELKRLLTAGDAPVTGAVMSVSGAVMKVRTPQGVIDARSVDGATYRAGDEVLVRDGIVRGRVTPAASVPVYSV